MGLVVFGCFLVVITGLYVWPPPWWKGWWDRLPEEWQFVVGVGTFLSILMWAYSLEQGLSLSWWQAFLYGYGGPLGLLILAYPFGLYSAGAAWWKQLISWMVLLAPVIALVIYLL